MSYLVFVHCRRCGNLDIQRVSAKHVDGWYAWIFRLLQLPAYRCPPCRRKFFSVLIHRRMRPVDELLSPDESDAVSTVPQAESPSV
jgi:hypothetical protein